MFFEYSNKVLYFDASIQGYNNTMNRKYIRKMATKVTARNVKVLNLRNVPLVDHWRLETWADDKGLGKYEAAEKLLHDALRHVKLPTEHS
jgi:hypothetical protein